MPNPKFELYKDNAGEFRFRLRAGNGEKILSSESYKDNGGATNGIESVKKNAPSDDRYERKTSSDGKFFFTLRAGNNEVIGTSETYSSADARDEGIEDVKRIAPSAPIEDDTDE